MVEQPGPDAFITQTPKDAYESGNVRKVPAIQGLVEDEGDLFAFGMYNKLRITDILDGLNY